MKFAMILTKYFTQLANNTSYVKYADFTIGNIAVHFIDGLNAVK